MAALLSTSVSRSRCLWRRAGTAIALVASATTSWGAGPKPTVVKPGDPAISLAADRYGYLPLPPRYLAAGLSMFTLHFVDDSHVLFTFHSHGLMPRLADSAPDDNDRRVTAVLIELPSGKELARTVWRTRDQEQYLWPLAHGRFMLRIRSKLTVIDPLRRLAEGNAFGEQPFLEFKRRIGYVEVSPGGELLSVETLPPRAQEGSPAMSMDAGPPRDASDAPGRSVVETRFYRLIEESVAGKPEKLIASAAGGVITRSIIHVPATSEGFIDVTKDGSNGYLFDFQSHEGKRMELAGYETTCAPRTYLVSRSEFVAFGCQLQGQSLLSEFDLRGQEPWVQGLGGSYVVPIVTPAPAAGRFALSRILVTGTYVSLDNLLPDEMQSQELTVMQNHDGRLLLKTHATPIERAGQNFDLSGDGLSFVTMQTTQTVKGEETIQKAQIVVYRLGELTATDQKQIKLATEAVPAKNEAPVRLLVAGAPKHEAEGEKVTVQTAAKSVTTVEVPAEPAPKATLGDVHPDEDAPRKPPSLYDPEHPKVPPPS